MLNVLLRFLAAWPLPLLHLVGVGAGWIIFWTDKKFSRRTRKNLKMVGLTNTSYHFRRLLRRNVAETGKSILETLSLWGRSRPAMLRWVKRQHGWEHVDQALASGKGIIFLTPHLGCYEITARFYATLHPITILFRPARKSWLSDTLEQGRLHDRMKLAPTTLSGVRNLLKALKKGEAVGILPDQVPEHGEGVWAQFFNHPAYTMTLVSKLQEATGAVVLMAFGERLSWGRGFAIHITPLQGQASPQHINDAIEQLVRQYPAQYLWSYRRFKQPQSRKAEAAVATIPPSQEQIHD